MRKFFTVALTLVGVGFAAVALAQAVPADIVYPNQMLGDTTFKHSTHSADAGIQCTECHTAIFPMKAKETKITMADMNAGKNCGTCHKAGGKAFAATECAKCHIKK